MRSSWPAAGSVRSRPVPAPAPRRAPRSRLGARSGRARPHRLGAGRRGSGAGDAPRGMARPRELRGAIVDAHLALPDCDQPLAERASRPRPPAPRASGAAGGAARAGAADPRARADLARALSRQPARGRCRALARARRARDEQHAKNRERLLKRGSRHPQGYREIGKQHRGSVSAPPPDRLQHAARTISPPSRSGDLRAVRTSPGSIPRLASARSTYHLRRRACSRPGLRLRDARLRGTCRESWSQLTRAIPASRASPRPGDLDASRRRRML